MSAEINVIIRLMPGNEDIDVTIPTEATTKDIVETLLESGLGIPRVDKQGTSMTYNLMPKGKNEELREHQTMEDAQIQEGDVILMIPHVIAGCFKR